MEIYHLEDADFSVARVKEEVEKEKSLQGVTVTTFRTRLELETAWQMSKPSAVILDLLVPEKYRWLAKSLLGRPPNWLLWLWYLIRKLIAFGIIKLFNLDVQYLIYLRGILRKKEEKLEKSSATTQTTREEQAKKLKKILESTGKGEDHNEQARESDEPTRDELETYWGGVEFLVTRAKVGDRGSVPFYVYSLALNSTYLERARSRELAKAFAEICEQIVKFYRRELEGKLAVKSYAKGYIHWRSGVPTVDFESDEFGLLLEQLTKDLNKAS